MSGRSLWQLVGALLTFPIGAFLLFLSEWINDRRGGTHSELLTTLNIVFGLFIVAVLVVAALVQWRLG